MTDQLFNIDESLSPRLKWMRENDITVSKSIDCAYDPPEVEFIAKKLVTVSARSYDRDSAIAALAAKLNLKLWDE